jgi:predicted benzoate:H+ symporter BenE
MIAKYFLMGVLAPSFLNLIHLVIGIYVVMARGNLMSLGFSAMGFLTKTIGMLFLTWLGIEIVGLDYRIFVPILTFVWFFSHIAEAFVIQHYMEKNVPEWVQRMQIK